MTRVLVPPVIDTAGPALGGQVFAVAGETMGTTWSVRFVGPAGADTARRRGRIAAVLDRLVDAMSHWQPASELSRFNAAPAGSWHGVSPELLDVLVQGLAVARASGGAFDPTAGALVDRWGFGATGRHDEPGFVPPARDDVEAARARGGWQRLVIDPSTRRVQQPGGLRLDLSGIGKGFAVDVLADRLRADGVTDVLVEVGGELRGHGVRPDGQPWWTAIEPPPAAPSALPETRIALHGLAVATSGDYRRHYTLAGERIAHTVDPRDGRPVANGVASCTVVHASCTSADAWSTALTVLGPDDGRALADREGLAARWLVQQRDGGWSEHWSRAFEDLLG